MRNKNLVTVVVVTYNSADTVIETLNSIKSQTYRDIELIISDDKSIDNTVSICKEWLSLNEWRFVRSKILTSSINTGVAANANRGLSQSSGYWYKGIAGDDILLDDCIEKNVTFMLAHPNFEIVFSKCYLFNSKNGEHNIFSSLPSKEGVEMLDLTTPQQLIVLYYGLFIPTPTAFMKMSVFDSIRYDERYKAFEDTPFFIKAVENGIHIDFMDEYTVKYRFADSSSHPSTRLENERLWNTYNKYFYENTMEKIVDKYPQIYRYKRARIMLSDFRIFCLGNKPTLLRKLLSYIYSLFLHKDLSLSQSEVIKIAKQYVSSE